MNNTTIRKDTNPIRVFLFGDSTYPLLPFIMTQLSSRINIEKEFFSNK